MARDTVMEQRGHFFGVSRGVAHGGGSGAKPPENFQDFNVISLIFNE